MGDQLGEDEGAQGGLLGWFKDDGVATGQSRAKFPRRHRQGIVPGYDLSYHADGLAEGVGEFLVGGADGLAEDFVGPAGVVAEGGDGFGQVFSEGDGVGFP